MKDELEALAVRVEQADGPSRGLDALIHSFAASETPWIVGHKPGRFPQEPIYGKIADYREWAEKTLDGEPHEGISLADAIAAPGYTASIDAALTLVGDELVTVVLRRALDRLDQCFKPMDNYLAKLRLCVVAAALRARASMETGK